MKKSYAIYQAMLLTGAYLFASSAIAIDLGNSSFGFSYNGNAGAYGGSYYPNSVIGAGAGVNSLYQIGGCFPGAGPYGYGQGPGYPGYNSPPFVQYPQNFPPVPYMGAGGGSNRPSIPQFQSPAPWIPPHVQAAQYYNAPNFLPPPVNPCSGPCSGGLYQPAPIFPVAGGPLVQQSGSGHIYNYGSGVIADLRSEVDFSGNLMAAAFALNGNAPNYNVRAFAQQPLQLNLGDYRGEDGYRPYGVVPRTDH